MTSTHFILLLCSLLLWILYTAFVITWRNQIGELHKNYFLFVHGLFFDLLEWPFKQLERLFPWSPIDDMTDRILLIAMKASVKNKPATYDVLPKAVRGIAFDVTWAYRVPDWHSHLLQDREQIRKQIEPLLTQEVIEEYDKLRKQELL